MPRIDSSSAGARVRRTASARALDALHVDADVPSTAHAEVAARRARCAA